MEKLEFIGTCSSPEIAKIAESCKRPLSKKRMNRIVKEQFPDIYSSLSLDLNNPYEYYQNNQYCNLVHSAIDYVFRKVF